MFFGSDGNNEINEKNMLPENVIMDGDMIGVYSAKDSILKTSIYEDKISSSALNKYYNKYIEGKYWYGKDEPVVIR